jgi:hypothetical protein
VARTCSVCRHDARESIDEALTRRVPLRDISKRHGGVSIAALSRHSQAHLSPALKAVVVEREREGPRSALDRLEDLYRDARSILDAALNDGKASLSLSAVRELRGIVTDLAKITCELDERPQLAVVNVLADPQWIAARTAMLDALTSFPDARRAVVERLRALEPA